jgi:1-acyl-sn-glycerol-3-phosphate acyltransferase
VDGLERLPGRGPFIVASNHHNYLDGVVLGVAVPRPIAFLVMPGVFRASVLHPAFHRRIGSIPISVEGPDLGAVRRAVRVLDGGGVVGIFPEGPFSHEGRLVAGQPGVALLALRAGVPVVPAAIHGTWEALAGRRLHIPRRHPLRVRFGPPLRFAWPRDRRARHALRGDVTRHIMDEIAALLSGIAGAGQGAEAR